MKCPTCGGDYVPPLLIAAEREWRTIPEVYRASARHLLKGYQLHGTPVGRGWNGYVWEALTVLSPKVSDAVAEHGADAVTEFLGLFKDDVDEKGGCLE